MKKLPNIYGNVLLSIMPFSVSKGLLKLITHDKIFSVWALVFDTGLKMITKIIYFVVSFNICFILKADELNIKRLKPIEPEEVCSLKGVQVSVTPAVNRMWFVKGSNAIVLLKKFLLKDSLRPQLNLRILLPQQVHNLWNRSTNL
jgi:hypothetical protein